MWNFLLAWGFGVWRLGTIMGEPERFPFLGVGTDMNLGMPAIKPKITGPTQGNCPGQYARKFLNDIRCYCFVSVNAIYCHKLPSSSECRIGKVNSISG